MARALPAVTTVGVRSRGASANPRPFPVFPDLVLWSSTWRALGNTYVVVAESHGPKAASER